MFTAMGLMLAGILLGRLLRGQAWLPYLIRCISPVIMLMLFCLGVAVGGNAMLMENLPLLGGKALMLTVCGVVGSLACVALIRRFFHTTRGPALHDAWRQSTGCNDRQGRQAG